MVKDADIPTADEFARLEDGLFSRIATRHRRQVLRHRLVVTAAVLVIAGAGVAAGRIANPTQQSKFAYCYEGATTASHVAQVAFPTGRGYVTTPGNGASPQQVRNALFLCQTLWSEGVLGSGGGARPAAVPPLQVCLRDDLIVSVFRKSNSSESAEAFCDNLGLGAP